LHLFIFTPAQPVTRTRALAIFYAAMLNAAPNINCLVCHTDYPASVSCHLLPALPRNHLYRTR